jgi:ankyrin repeat protein
LHDWVNQKTNADKFTALHLASFRGNVHNIKLLIREGADIYAKNKYGINMIHVAAQGDQISSLVRFYFNFKYYFYKAGICINETDDKGSTAVHWACYSKSEVALNYLLAWGP